MSFGETALAALGAPGLATGQAKLLTKPNSERSLSRLRAETQFHAG
jgi:hypothetical protein